MVDISGGTGSNFGRDAGKLRAVEYTYESIAKLIDHALLKPTLTDAELEAGCELALDYGVASVCIVPHALARCAKLLAGSDVQPSTVIGFPHGSESLATKLKATEQALADGGTELDMVVNIGKLLSDDLGYVRREVAEVLGLVRSAGQKLKVIFEACYLEAAHKQALCELCSELRVDWVKTSTGFGAAGATPEDVRFLREHSRPEVQVKASGGIRTLDRVLEMRALGATRVGTSSTVEILNELEQRLAAASKGSPASHGT